MDRYDVSLLAMAMLLVLLLRGGCGSCGSWEGRR